MTKKLGDIEEDHLLSRVEREKNLGITVDTKLHFEQHINDKVTNDGAGEKVIYIYGFREFPIVI